MGGQKKRSLKQIERAQARRREADKTEKKKEKKIVSKEKIIGVLPPSVKNKKIVSEVKKMKVLTPFAVSTKFNIRISAAKDFLEQLEQIGAIELVSGNHTIKIYKPIVS